MKLPYKLTAVFVWLMLIFFQSTSAQAPKSIDSLCTLSNIYREQKKFKLSEEYALKARQISSTDNALETNVELKIEL